MSLIEGKGLSVRFGKNLVVDNVNIDIKKGEVVGLIGPNGAGKSTVLKALSGIVEYQEGSVELLGKVVLKNDLKYFSQKVSYMAQDTIFHWPITVENIVALGRLPFLSPWQQLTQKDAEVIGRSMIEAEIDHLKGRLVTKLSGGEKRLVMFARALASESSVILADEPVSGLDPSHQIQVMELFKKKAELSRYGVLVVLHDLSLAARYCHRLYLLDQGKVFSQGTPSDVLVPENVERVYKVTAHYTHDGQGLYVFPTGRVQLKTPFKGESKK